MKYAAFALLLALGTLASCIDDDFLCVENENETLEDFGYTDGYAINFAVTLDNMGGTRAAASSVEELTKAENYIDPEKFRVLFFDADDKFLFESKSRWIKQLTPTGAENSQWLVSVPIYTFGNDEEYNWDWEAIREALTAQNKFFKIAILANRPGEELCIDYDAVGLKDKWYDNAGPYWGRKQTVWYAKQHANEGIEPKDVFDLHHSQFDPIYTAKSWPSTYAGSEGFYEFVMGEENDKLTMSSTSSWVDFRENDLNNRDPYGFNRRYFVQPSMSHPIPMYGIQRFETINGDRWIKGTPFNLSNLSGTDPEEGSYHFNKIALLRSVVRLDLVIPESDDYEVEFVFMGYPNVYARCEPMDVWTPTSDLWAEEHDNDCEWNDIVNYGPVSRTYDTKSNSTLLDYQKRLCWFYGAWLDKDWKFGSLGRSTVEEAVAVNGPSPRIFNSCIQRNNAVYCGNDVDMTTQYNDGNYHYVVYTGERNVNDPSDLNSLGNGNGGKATVTYWGICIKTGNTYKYYKVPLTDLGQAENVSQIIASEIVTIDNNGKWKEPSTSMQSYENLVQDPGDETPKPWPLMRNHVYTTTIIPTGSHTWNFKVVNVDNLNADANWSNPWGIETKYLAHGAITNKGNTNGIYSADVNWWSGTTLKRSSQNQFNTDNTNKIKIGNTEYSVIKTGKGDNGADDRWTTLTLPNTKEIRKFTLYSFIGTGATYEETPMNIIDYPADQSGIEIVEGGTAEFGSVNIHKNADNVPGIKIANSTAKNGVKLSVGNGFSANDIIKIYGAFNDNDDTKQSAFALYASSAENATPIMTFGKNAVNGRTSANDPVPMSYTLEKSYNNLFIGCVGASGTPSGETKEWKNPSNGNVAEIMKNDMVTVNTVYAAARNTQNVTIDGKSFTSYIQLRTSGIANAANPTGGQQSECTPLIVTAHKNVEFTLYLRRQAVNGGYGLDDGKDLLCYAQNDKPFDSVEETWDIDGSYGYAKKTYKFSEGGTYTLYRNGSTMRLYGFTVKEKSAAEEKLATDMFITKVEVLRNYKDKVRMPSAYWSKVDNKDYCYYQTGVNSFVGEKDPNNKNNNAYDKYEFKTDPEKRPNEIRFTTPNECNAQLCYVAAVEVQDKNNTTDYWSYSLNKMTADSAPNANDLPLGELDGLKFSKAGGSIKIYDNEEGKISLTGATFEFPQMRKGYSITMVGQSSSSGSIAPASGFNNGSHTFGSTREEYTWTVTSNTVTPKFTVTGTIDFYEFRITAPSSSGARSTRSADSAGSEFMIKTENLYSKSLK